MSKGYQNKWFLLQYFILIRFLFTADALSAVLLDILPKSEKVTKILAKSFKIPLKEFVFNKVAAYSL